MTKVFKVLFLITSVVFLSGCANSIRTSGMEHKTIVVGEPFDAMEGVSVRVYRPGGAFDQDITDKVTFRGFVDVNQPDEYAIIYSYPVREYANDTTAPSSATRRRFITVVRPEPQILGLANQRVLLGTTIDLREGITVTDHPDGNLTSALQVEGEVNVNEVGVYVVTYSAIDSDENLTVRSITVTVFTDTDPVIEAEDQSFFLNTPFDPYEYVQAFDQEDGVFSNEDIEVIGEVIITQAGIYPITYRVTDSDGNTVEKTINVTYVMNQPPVIFNATDVTVWQFGYDELLQKFSTITARDPEDGEVTVRYNTNFNLMVPGVYPVTASAVDSMGARTSVGFTITVRADRPPVITGLRDFSIPLGQSFDLPRGLLEGVRVSDDKDGDTLSIFLIQNIDLNAVGTYPVTYRVRDSGGNRVERTVNFTVRPNTNPVLSGVTSSSVFLNAAFDPLAGVSAFDAEDGDLTASIVVTGVVNTSAPGITELTYSVTDSDNNTVTQTIEVNVILNVPPTISNASDITVFQGDSLALSLAVIPVTAQDALGNDITGNIVVSGNWNLLIPSVYTFTYNVTDSFGNFNSVDVSLTVLEDLAPALSGVVNANIWQGDAFNPLAGVSALDDKDGDLTSLISVDITPAFDVNVPGTYDAVYSVTDSFGNVVSQSAILTVVEDLPPVLSGVMDQTIDLFDTIDLAFGVSVSDDKDGDLTGSLQIVTDLDEFTVGVYTVTYTAIDSFGNITTMVATITVVDPMAVPLGTIMAELNDLLDFTVFIEALEQTGLDVLLNGAGPYTVFAPNDFAFDVYFSDEGYNDKDDFLANHPNLVAFLNNHIVSGVYEYDDLEDIANSSSPTLIAYSTETLTFGFIPSPPSLAVEGVPIFSGVNYADNFASNGVFHILEFNVIDLSSSGGSSYPDDSFGGGGSGSGDPFGPGSPDFP